MEYIIGGLLLLITIQLIRQAKANKAEIEIIVTATNGYADEQVEEKLDSDDWKDDFEVPGFPIPVKASFKLLYTDSKGSTTERLVDIKECDSVGKTGLLIGYCHLRRSIRTFRLDRINRVIDVETGEVVPNLQAHLKASYEQSPAFALHAMLDESYDIIRTLLYFGKVDGRLIKAEKQVMLEYCQNHTGNDQIDMEDLESALYSIDVPTKQSYKLACNRIAKSTESERRLVIELAYRIVHADKKLDPDEKSALEYLERKLEITAEPLVA